MNHKLIIVIVSIIIGCTFPPKEKILEVDSKGRVLKTFNGQLIKSYDTVGNLIEFYGNVHYDDWEGCVHDKIFYNQDNKIYLYIYNTYGVDFILVGLRKAATS